MRARRITELESTLKNEMIGMQRQLLLKQIWKLRCRLEQESSTSEQRSEQPSPSLLSPQREKAVL